MLVLVMIIVSIAEIYQIYIFKSVNYKLIVRNDKKKTTTKNRDPTSYRGLSDTDQGIWSWLDNYSMNKIVIHVECVS